MFGKTPIFIIIYALTLTFYIHFSLFNFYANEHIEKLLIYRPQDCKIAKQSSWFVHAAKYLRSIMVTKINSRAVEKELRNLINPCFMNELRTQFFQNLTTGCLTTPSMCNTNMLNSIKFGIS